MKWALLALLIAAVAPGVGPAAAQTSHGASMNEVSGNVLDAVSKVVAAEVEAWNAGDAAAFSAATRPDVVFTNIVGLFSVGRAPFQAQHEKIFSTIYKGSRMAQSIVHVSLVRPDVAIVDTLAELKGFSHLPPGSEAVDGVLKTRLEQVMVLEDGRWQVASFHNVPVNPAATGGVPPK